MLSWEVVIWIPTKLEAIRPKGERKVQVQDGEIAFVRNVFKCTFTTTDQPSTIFELSLPLRCSFSNTNVCSNRGGETPMEQQQWKKYWEVGKRNQSWSKNQETPNKTLGHLWGYGYRAWGVSALVFVRVESSNSWGQIVRNPNYVT